MFCYQLHIHTIQDYFDFFLILLIIKIPIISENKENEPDSVLVEGGSDEPLSQVETICSIFVHF